MNNAAANTKPSTSSSKAALIARLEREAEERLQAALADIPADWADPSAYSSRPVPGQRRERLITRPTGAITHAFADYGYRW